MLLPNHIHIYTLISLTPLIHHTTFTPYLHLHTLTLLIPQKHHIISSPIYHGTPLNNHYNSTTLVTTNSNIHLYIYMHSLYIQHICTHIHFFINTLLHIHLNTTIHSYVHNECSFQSLTTHITSTHHHTFTTKLILGVLSCFQIFKKLEACTNINC